MEQRLSLVTLGVADLARSRRFYEEGLGWRASAASTGEVAFFQLGGIALAHNVRTREEVDAVLARARAAGGRVPRPAAEADRGGYTGCFADPDGHLWEVAWNPGFALRDDGGLQLPP